MTSSAQASTRSTASPQHSDQPVVLSLQGVSKKFCKNLTRSMAYGVIDILRVMLNRRPPSSDLRPYEFWAVDDVTLDVERGGIVGLMGPNGCGKTTLLRMISGILPPDRGRIVVRGRLASLISLGAGFHPHMTGRENIFINGSLLGMTRQEIESRSPDIIEFAELDDFIDSPVATYSSGMRVRLGFAIAVKTNPDIFVIDEALAVGDHQFKVKCLKELERISETTTVLIASHSVHRIMRLCTRMTVMSRGRIVLRTADIQEGIEFYESQLGR